MNNNGELCFLIGTHFIGPQEFKGGELLSLISFVAS